MRRVRGNQRLLVLIPRAHLLQCWANAGAPDGTSYALWAVELTG
jgi:hypothetical protein